MDYRIYKLSFTTPCRFGTGAGLQDSDITCDADTLFAALANECVNFYGNETLEAIKQRVENDEFLISDLLPYNEDCLFLPKPLYSAEKKIVAESLAMIKKRMAGAKKLKKLQYIPVYDFEYYIECMKNNKLYINEQEKNEDSSICEKQLVEKVNCRGGESLPYFVEQINFKENCGLYFIAEFANKSDIKLMDNLLQLLSYAGIGGKRSSGYGKFTYTAANMADNDDADIAVLYKLVNNKEGSSYMSLSALIPTKDDIDILQEGFFHLNSCSGFVSDNAYNDVPLKRNRYFSVSQGSCFKTAITGSIIDVNNGGKHPVYRYGKAIYARLSL